MAMEKEHSNIGMKILNCPKGHGPMEQKQLKKQKTIKGVDIEYVAGAFICPECGLEAGTVQYAGKVQRAMLDAYRKREAVHRN
jgi:uncharacterized protein YbaR (Trm112 family)